MPGRDVWNCHSHLAACLRLKSTPRTLEEKDAKGWKWMGCVCGGEVEDTVSRNHPN